MTVLQDMSENENGFAALGLSGPLVDTLKALSYTLPTPIQISTIPLALKGVDLIGMAATGTGKTAAYVLPLLEKMALDRAQQKKPELQKAPKVLILVPTRELAGQVATSVEKYGKALKVRVTTLYGGQAYGPQLDDLKRGVDFVVGTPGRILDHIKRGSLNISATEGFVLDEADEMLDMGFAEDIKAIFGTMPAKKQTLFFSATMPAHVSALAQKYLSNPTVIKIAREATADQASPAVRQVVYSVDRQHKVAAIQRLLDWEQPGAAIIFCRTRDEVDALNHALRSRHAEALHGGLSQAQREKIMSRLRSRSTSLIVATDVAARGLDIDHLTHVINFDFPASAETYIHRIGRVGRAGREGVALSLAEPRHFYLLRQIEKATKSKITVQKVPSRDQLFVKQLQGIKTKLMDHAPKVKNIETYKKIVQELKDEHTMGFDDIAALALAMAYGQSDADQGGSDFSSVVLGAESSERRGSGRRESSRDSSYGKGSGSGSGSQRSGGRSSRGSRFESKQRFGSSRPVQSGGKGASHSPSGR